MKRLLLWCLTLVASLGVGFRLAPEPVADIPPPRVEKFILNANVPSPVLQTAEEAAAALPSLAAALALPQGTAQTEATLRALVDLKPGEFPAALSLLLPTQRSSLASWIAEQWAMADATAAMSFASSPAGLTWLRGEHGGALQMGFMHGLLRSHPAWAEQLAAQLQSPYARQNFFAAMLKHDPAQALQWVQQGPGLEVDTVSLGNVDAELANQIATLPAGPLKQKLLGATLESLLGQSFDDPKLLPSAISWWQKLSAADQVVAITDNFREIDGGPWNKAFAEKLSANDIIRLQAALAADPMLRTDAKAIGSLAILQATRDPVSAYHWASDTLTGKTRADTLATIVATSVPNSLAALSPFLDTMPPGPLRDQAAAAAFEKCATVDPAALARWAENRTDPGERKALLVPSISRWASTDPKAAAHFLTTDIPPTRRPHLMLKVMQEIPHPQDQLALAQQLPEPQAASVLVKAWELHPPAPEVLTRAATTQPPGPLHEAMIRSASVEILRQKQDHSAWQTWVQTLPAADQQILLRN